MLDEPRWTVIAKIWNRAASITYTTSLPIPEGITGEEISAMITVECRKCSITKIIICYEAWNVYCWWRYVLVYTRAFESWIACDLISCSSKCPNMFTRISAMSKAHSIYVCLINAIIAIVMEGNWILLLVCYDPSIDMTVVQAMNRESITWTS